MFKIYLLDSRNYPAVLYDDLHIFEPAVLEPELEMNGDNGILIGKLAFKLHDPSLSPQLRLLQNTVIVTQMIGGVETVIFRGRPLLRDDDDYNDQDYTFEGILAGLNDTLQTPSTDKGIGFTSHLAIILNRHNYLASSYSYGNKNRMVDYSKIDRHFESSYMHTIEGDPFSESLAYKANIDPVALDYVRTRASTMDHLKTQFIDSWGGYFYLENEPLTYDSDGCIVLHNYLNYVDIYSPDQVHINAQRIEFGKNLISIRRSVSADDFATVLIPLGKQLTDIEKAWPYYQSVENNKVRKIVSSPDDAVLENYNSTNAYINSETAAVTTGGGSSYVILNDVEVEPGDVFYLTTYLEGFSTDISAASYAILSRDATKVFSIGSSVRNSKDSGGTVTVKNLVLKDERIEIPTPEDTSVLLKLRTAYMISANDPNGGFVLKKFNPQYQEDNVTIMSVSPVATGTIRKRGQFDVGRDVFPDATEDAEAPELYEQSKRVYNNDLYEIFGSIEKVIEFSDYGIDHLSTIYSKAAMDLEKMGEDLEIEIQAADLSYIDETQEPFQPYDLVPVYSEPHGIDMMLPIVKMTLPLADPAAATYTLQNDIHLSEDSKKYISQMVSSPSAGTQKNQTVIIYNGGGSSGGGGGGEVPVRELPDVTVADNGKVLGVVNGQWAVKEDETGESGDSLPAVTSADNGKVLGVVNGEWAVKEDEDTDDELPAVTSADNGKVLGVVNGQWAVKEDDTAGNDIFRTAFTSKRSDALRSITNGHNVSINGQVLADIVNENHGGCQLIEIDTVSGNDVIYDVDAITDSNISFYRITDGKRHVITVPLNSNQGAYSVSDEGSSGIEAFEVTITKASSSSITYSASYSQISQAISDGKIIKFKFDNQPTRQSYSTFDYAVKYSEGGLQGYEVKFLDDVDADSETVYIARFNYDSTYSLNEITLDADGSSSGSDKFFAYYGIDNNGYGCNVVDKNGNDVQGYVIRNLIETINGGCILVVTDRFDSNQKVIYDLDEYSISNTQDVIFYRIADGNRSTITIPANSNRGTFASEPLASVSGAVVYNASQSLTDSQKRVARRNVGLNGYAIGLRHKLYSGQQSAGSFYAILADGTVSSSPLTFSDIWNAYYNNDKCFIFAYDDDDNVYKLKHIGNDSIVLNRVDGSTEYLITMSLMSGETPSTAMNTSANKSSVPIGGGGGSTPETFLISLSYNSSTDTWTCNKTAAEILSNMANSMVYYQGYRYYVTSMLAAGSGPTTIYYEKQEVGSSNGIEEFKFEIQNDSVTITRYTTPLNLFEIPIVYVTPANGDPYWDIDGILAGTIYNNYKDCVLVTGNKRIHIIKSFRSEDPQDKYVELIGVEPASNGSDLTIWKLIAEGNSNQHASISTYTFDGGSGNPFIINVIRSGNNYSTNAKASDIVAALPNVLLSWSSDIYTIDGYDTDEGFVNSAVFTKKKFNDGVIESTDTFFVVQEDSSVDAVSVYKRSESNSYYYISNGIVKDSVTNNAVTGESINATFGVSGKEPVIDEGTSYFEHIIYHFYRYGSNGIYFRSLDGNYEIYIPWLQSSITKSRFGYNTPYRLRAQWDNSQNKYILQRFEEGQWKSARYVDVAEHRESLWLGQRLPVDRVEFTEGFVTAYFYDVQLSSSGFSIIEWVIDAYGTDEIVVTRNVINNIQRTAYYAVTLNANGTVNTRSNDLDVVTVSARMSNPAFADYLLVTWGSTLFTAKAVEKAANGDIKFICDVEHDGIQRHMVFTLDSDNTLTTTAIETYSLRPVTVWEVQDATQGLSALNANISSSLAWQLTNLNLAPFKRIKIYSRAGRKTGSLAADSSITPASIIEMSLDDRAKETVSQNVFIASSVVQNPNDPNRLGILTCAVSADKTKFAVVRATTLYGTAATSNTDAYPCVFKIEGYYD